MKYPSVIAAALFLICSCSERTEKTPPAVNTTDSATVAYPPGSLPSIDTTDYNNPGPSTVALDSSRGVGPDSGSAR